MHVTTVSLSGWNIMAILIKKISSNQFVFYAQNRLAIYNMDKKTAEVLTDHVVIPEYDKVLKESEGCRLGNEE